jgi:hypothetical protein
MAVIEQAHRALIAQTDPCKQVEILVTTIRRISHAYTLGVTTFMNRHAIFVGVQIVL